MPTKPKTKPKASAKSRKPPKSPKTRATYRHGNLRQALIDEALILIREHGAEALNVREAARRIGVSHNAYTRHFADRDSLLAAISLLGHTDLAQAMLAAIQSVDANASPGATPAELALQKIQTAGRAYIRFALAHPAHYAAMYDHAYPLGKHPELDQVSYHSFGVLQSIVEACQAQGLMSPGPSLVHTCLCWSSAHGVAHLINSDRMHFDTEEKALAFVDFATASVLGHWPFTANTHAPLPPTPPLA